MIINSENRAFGLELEFVVLQPSQVWFIGEDVSNPNTVFFSISKEAKTGKNKAKTQLPVSPKNMRLKYDDRLIQIKRVIPKTLPYCAIFQEPEDRAASIILLDFALKAGYSPSNKIYQGGIEGLEIQYLNGIRDARSRKVEGPARVNLLTGVLQIDAKKFRQYTVPCRFFILLHEYFHLKLQTHSEIEVDAAAIRPYLSAGFPKLDLVYALTQVLSDSKQSIERAEEVMRLIDFHTKNCAL